ncbi:hypothetical protein GCM10027082_06900 [Comamonas humi]
MSLVQPLPDGPVDIVGDIHGEYDALMQLLHHLGYDAEARHPEQRTLIFVGDFCDRGPDSPAVLHKIRQWVEAGRAAAVLGNHEINLLREDAKDGAGWFFDARVESDNRKYAPYARPTEAERRAIPAFLQQLPIALERDDLRVVHAAWIDPKIATARMLTPGSIAHDYDALEAAAAAHARMLGIRERMDAEKAAWPYSIEEEQRSPPFMAAHAENELNKSMFNPLKVLTCGIERRGREPFFAGGKWRFVERVAWWDEYDDPTPVVVGHYWRRVQPIDRKLLGKGDMDMFAYIGPFAWHGKRRNVFCVDYSVGARWTARLAGRAPEQDFKLAALRWPERQLMFDDGLLVDTTDFRTDQVPDMAT